MSQTTLSVFCSVFGWQGGTIHQAKQRAAIASLAELDKLCTRLAAEIADISDPHTAAEFMALRREANNLHINALKGGN